MRNQWLESPRARALFAVRCAILMAMVAGIWWAGDRIDIIRGESIPYSIAWIEGGVVHKGDYVVFEATHPIINGGVPSHLTKQVVCVEGERVHFDGERWFCGTTELGGVIHKTYDGRDVPIASIEGPIPTGKAFVLGSHPRSFDSRYLGLLDVSTLTVVRPLL